jgi:hypothetical protein
MKAWTRFKQLRYPREFRIPDSAWPEEFDRFLREWRDIRMAAPASKGPELGEKLEKLMADIGTGLWRLRQKMLDPDTGKPREDMRRAFRHLESVWDAIHGEGFEIQDHAGNPFDSGQALIPIAFQETPGLSREVVLETIKPTIYFRKKAIQVGEVIVGKPPSGHPPEPAAST